MIGRIVLGVAAVATAGCLVASRPMPEINGRLALKVTNERLSSRPFGVHQIPDTSVYVSGHQGGADVGMIFGPIGLLWGHAAAKATGEKKTMGARAQLGLDLPKLTEHVLAEELTRRPDAGRFEAAGSPAAGTLELKPYLVVNFVGNDQARLWVVLQAMLKNAATGEKWKTQYVASVGEVRPMAGEQGWAADDGAFLQQHVDHNLHVAVDVLLRDASRAFPRNSGRTVNVKSNWVWVKEPRERTAMLLDESAERLVLLPCGYENDADAFVFTGVTILDKKAVTLTRQSSDPQPCLGKHLDIN